MKLKVVLVLAVVFAVGCGAVRDLADAVADEVVDRIGDNEGIIEPDPVGIDETLRIACCLVGDSVISAQIQSMEVLRSDGLDVLEALQQTGDNCDDATGDDSVLELCCLTCAVAVTEHVYGVVP